MSSKPKIGRKPASFPGRVNDRRIAALGRIQDQLASGVRRTRLFGDEPLSAEDRSRLNAEGDTLALRILSPEHARAIRTKKNRAGRGKFSRTA